MDVTNRINYNNSSNNSYLGGDCSLDELTSTFTSLRLSAFTSVSAHLNSYNKFLD